MIDSFHSFGNSSLFQIEIISLWIAERIVLPPALINSSGTVFHISTVNVLWTDCEYYIIACVYWIIAS